MKRWWEIGDAHVSTILLVCILNSALFLQVLVSLTWAKERFQPDDAQVATLAILQGSFASHDQIGGHYDGGSTISGMGIIILLLIATAYLRPKYWRLAPMGTALVGIYCAERAISVITITDVPDTMEASFAGIPLISGAQVTDPTAVPHVAAALGVFIAIFALIAAMQPPSRQIAPPARAQHA